MAGTPANPINMAATGMAYFNGSSFTAPSLTQHGTVIAGASGEITSLGVASNGYLAIGSSGANPVLGAITSNDGSLTVSLGAGTIDLSASPSYLSLGAFGSTPNADGLSLASNVLNMQPADGTHPGGVSTSAQTFSGVKTFSSAPIFSTLTGILIGNGGSAVSAQTVTQHDVLVGAASNGITSVSPSTAGYVLTSNGGSSDPSFQALPAGNGFTFVSVSSAPTTATDHIYMATAALTVTLPSAPADGYVVGLINASSGTVLFQASGTDVIQALSSVGAAAGSATSTVMGEFMWLAYQASNGIWFATNFAGASWSIA
jgi:hypothetical protein